MNDVALIYEQQKAINPRLTYDVFQAILLRFERAGYDLKENDLLAGDIKCYYHSVDCKACSQHNDICDFIRSYKGKSLIDDLNGFYGIHYFLEFTYQEVASIFVKNLTPEEANYILNNGDLFNTKLCKHLRLLPELVSCQF